MNTCFYESGLLIIFVFYCSAEHVQASEASGLGNLDKKLPSDAALFFQQIKAMAKECNQQPTSSITSVESQAQASGTY